MTDETIPPKTEEKKEEKKEVIERKEIKNTNTNTNMNYTIDLGEDEIHNEVEVDLQNGVIKIMSKNESLDKCVKTMETMLKKMSGPDMHRYVT